MGTSVNFEDWKADAITKQGLFAQPSKEKCEEVYAFAYVLYQHRRYLEACSCFRLLVAADPSVPKYWRGLGSCLQMQKDYDEALNCYTLCARVSTPQQIDPSLYIQTADCFLALKEMEGAKRALDAAHSTAAKKGNKQILQHVAFMKQVWGFK